MERKQEVYALEVLREALQRFYDAVYPFDDAIGCRDLPTLAPNDLDSLRFNWDDFTDAIPDFGNVCDAAVQLLAMSDRFELRRRLDELKGATADFGRAHKAMMDAIGKTEYAARCDEANAAYARIRDLTEDDLAVVDGLLTKRGAAATGATATATPSVTFEQEAQGMTKRVIVNGMTDATKAQAQAVQAFANWNAPQGAQVAPQGAGDKEPDLKIPMNPEAVALYKEAIAWLERNPGRSGADAVWFLVTKQQEQKRWRVRIKTKGRRELDEETKGFIADRVEWDRYDPDVAAWGGNVTRYRKWLKDKEARSMAANQLVEPLPSSPLQIENKSPIRNKKPLKRVGKRRGK